MDDLQRLIRIHHDRNGVPQCGDPTWEIKESGLGGRGVFATKDIRAGELIFADYPLILGPRTCQGDICVSCYNNEHLRQCSKNCGLPVCSANCEDSRIHADECAKINEWKTANTEISGNLIRCLSPIRALFLDESGLELMKMLTVHENMVRLAEVTVLTDIMKLDIPENEEAIIRRACEVFDTNAYQVFICKNVTSLRGLYPLTCMLNHSCVPNTMHVFDSQRFMLLRATIDVKKGDELFSSYCRMLWGTHSRRCHLLRTKHFACSCERCTDPTEFNTYVNSVVHAKCDGLLLPIDPLTAESEWKCEKCAEIVSGNMIGFITKTLTNRLTTIDTDDLGEILKFYDNKIAGIVPENSQIFLDLKYRMVWALGYKVGYLLSEISDELLNVKEKFCYDILEVLKKLRLGLSRIRGTLLFEVLKCAEEKKRRGFSEIYNNEGEVFDAEKVMAEISNILLFDVTAPEEIEDYWERHKVDTNWRNYL